MTANIQTIFFDVGNTLRIVLPDQEFIDRAACGATMTAAGWPGRTP